MTQVEIHTPFIKLDSFLKFAGAVETGGDAKIMIQNGEVQVNGEKCLMRGKKLFPGDKVAAGGNEYAVASSTGPEGGTFKVRIHRGN